MWHRCKNNEELKILYKRLAYLLHPDTRGESDLFIILQESFNSEKDRRKEFDFSAFEVSDENEIRKKTVDHVFQGDPRLKIISDIEEYAKKNTLYNLSFIKSIKKYLVSKGYITSSQYNSMIRIWDSWDMSNLPENED